jgi:hypothetical protein
MARCARRYLCYYGALREEVRKSPLDKAGGNTRGVVATNIQKVLSKLLRKHVLVNVGQTCRAVGGSADTYEVPVKYFLTAVSRASTRVQ